MVRKWIARGFSTRLPYFQDDSQRMSEPSKIHRKRRRWFRRLLAGVAILIFVWQAVGFVIAYGYLNAGYHHPEPHETPTDHGLSFQEVSIPVEVEGQGTINLAGWLIPADSLADNFQDGAIVLMVHGFASGKAKIWTDEEIDYAASLLEQGGESLARGGFHVLMIDFRNYGGSDDAEAISLGSREADDILAALRFIREQLPKTDLVIDPARIGLRAPSMGGAASIFAIAKSSGDRGGGDGQQVGALWLDSTFANADDAVTDFLTHHGVLPFLLPPIKFWLQQLSGLRLSDTRPVDLIDQVKCPTMIVHSRDDTMIRVDHFFALQRATQSMPNVTTWLIDTHQHHRLWLNPEYLDRQLEFFRSHIGKQTDAAELADRESQ
jgi:fermentation-respiration switch protein FrsA (DUF1100 family)